MKAWAASGEHQSTRYDHILAYWGSYAATYGYVFGRLTDRTVPFSIFLHAGDLYQDQVYLEQKLRHASNIFVVCEFNREFIRRRYRSIYDQISHKIHVYHPSLDLDELPYRPDRSQSQRVIAVGRFDRCKGFDYLLRAIAQLVRDGVAVDVDLVGEGEESQALRSLARTLGIEDRVTFHGWLPFDQVRCAMHRARVLVHPSSELGDAVPTVIKEAMALGTPVIASDVAGIPELLQDGRCGILVRPRDVGQLAHAVRTMLTDARTCRYFAEQGRRFAENQFDVVRNGERLATILDSTAPII